MQLIINNQQKHRIIFSNDLSYDENKITKNMHLFNN